MRSGPARAATRGRTRLLAALAGSFVLMAAACTPTSSRFEPTTTGVGGRKVFVIYQPPCPEQASCAAEVVIDRRLYEYPGPPPRTTYRTGDLYAVGPDSEARTIPALGPTAVPVLALRVGSDWHVAIPFSAYPVTVSLARRICAVTVNDPGSYCVTNLGFPVGGRSV